MSKTIVKGQTASKAPSADVSVAVSNASTALIDEQECEAARPENQTPIDACEDAIRVRAYRIWEAAGYPTGDGVGFWLEAEREFNAEHSHQEIGTVQPHEVNIGENSE